MTLHGRAEIFIHIRDVLDAQYETVSKFYVFFRSQILVCHIPPGYIKVRTRSDQTTRLSSSDCIMPFFVNVYNTQCHVTQYVGGKLSHPACALIVCDVQVQTGSQGFLQFV